MNGETKNTQAPQPPPEIPDFEKMMAGLLGGMPGGGGDMQEPDFDAFAQMLSQMATGMPGENANKNETPEMNDAKVKEAQK